MYGVVLRVAEVAQNSDLPASSVGQSDSKTLNLKPKALNTDRKGFEL